MPDIAPKRLSRLLRLQRLLQAGMTVPEAAARLGVSTRTVQRDARTLAGCGALPNAVGGDESVRIPATVLSETEASQLFLLLEGVDASRIIPGFPLVGPVLEKLKDGLSQRQMDRFDVAKDGVTFADPRLSQQERASAFLHTCLDAFRRRRVVRAVYASVLESRQIESDLSIYHLTFRERGWYAVAASSLHADTRTFNLGRLVTSEVLETTYSVPQDFSIEDYFGNAWRMIRGDREFTIRVRFLPAVARSVADVSWHRTQTIGWHDDGSIDFTARVDGLHEVATWVLGYGSQAEVMEPPELRQLMSERLFATSRYYHSDR